MFHVFLKDEPLSEPQFDQIHRDRLTDKLPVLCTDEKEHSKDSIEVADNSLHVGLDLDKLSLDSYTRNFNNDATGNRTLEDQFLSAREYAAAETRARNLGNQGTDVSEVDAKEYLR